MRKNRGFKIKHKLSTVLKWIFDKPGKTIYSRFGTRKAMSKVCNWGCWAKTRLCIRKLDPGYTRMDHDTSKKGHLAVYVRESDDETLQRYMVPLIYLNHPLFGELLEEAEKAFGFSHPGAIQIPCRVSEFENVQTRIAAARR